MLQRLPPPDRTDGLEYDESKNQFKASYNDGLNRPHQNTLTRQRSPSRHRSPNRHTSPTRHLSPGRHVSPHHGRRVISPSGYDHNTHRAATMGRAADPSLGYHRPERPFEVWHSSITWFLISLCNTCLHFVFLFILLIMVFMIHWIFVEYEVVQLVADIGSGLLSIFQKLHLVISNTRFRLSSNQICFSQEYDTSRGQSLPARSLPPTHPLNSNYGVADSWVWVLTPRHRQRDVINIANRRHSHR